MKLVHFYVKLVLNNGEYSIVSTNSSKHNGNIELDYDFSNTSTPSNTNITVHGITEEHARMFKKNSQIDVYAGFYNSEWTKNNIHHVVNNVINNASLQPDDDNSKDLVINLQDGTTKYDNIKTIKVAQSKKVRQKSSMKSASSGIREKNDKIRKNYQTWRSQHKNLNNKSPQVHARRKQMNQEIANNRTQQYSKEARQQKNEAKQEKQRYKTVYKAISFKAGTNGSSIIKKIASMAGIPIYKMKLVKDRKYNNGYRASKRPFNVIKEVAKDCKSNVFFPHGKLTIADYAKQPHTNVTLNASNGLLKSPEAQSDKHGTTYNIEAIFQPQLTVGSIFRVESDVLTDEVIIQSGHSTGSRSSTPTTQLNVKQLSKTKKSKSGNKGKGKSSTQKRDEYNQKKAKNKRKARQQLKRKK